MATLAFDRTKKTAGKLGFGRKIEHDAAFDASARRQLQGLKLKFQTIARGCN